MYIGNLKLQRDRYIIGYLEDTCRNVFVYLQSETKIVVVVYNIIT